MPSTILAQKKLKELLHYDSETGVFTWKRLGKGMRSNGVAGCRQPSGYIRIRIDDELYYAHRLAFLYMIGEFPKDQADHINHIRHDNRWVNLRETTNQENHKNRPMQKNNTSGMVGVYRHKQSKKWRAQIESDGRPLHLGLFIDKFEAICTRKSAENKYGFHANHGAT